MHHTVKSKSLELEPQSKAFFKGPPGDLEVQPRLGTTESEPLPPLPSLTVFTYITDIDQILVSQPLN